jgi:hypothetical protein
MPDRDEGYARATSEANEVFANLGTAIDDQVSKGATELIVLDIARNVGLEIDQQILTELKVPEIIPVHPFIPWHVWFPWRPLWCWWWGFHYPWYRCCPWWWHRCHWWVG